LPRRTTRRRAVLGLVAATFAATGADVAHAFTDSGPARRVPLEQQERPPLLDAVDAARGRIGSPYAMGATGPDAFDCSGLTGYALRRAGVALPRDSFGQYGAGKAVERGDIRAGDLVFFSTAGSGASHVGLATGKSTVVSATSSGVMEHAISDAYWGGHYVGARRVTGASR
jgi:cell wall-associated NlpC family hydrolase